MAITRFKRTGGEPVEAGVWRDWSSRWIQKTAEENLDTRQHATEDALQLAPFTAAVLVLAKTVASSEWLVERINSDGDWERVTADLPAWLDPTKRPSRFQSHSDFRKQVSLSTNIFGNSIILATDRRWRGGWPNQMVAYPWRGVNVSLDGVETSLEDRWRNRNSESLGIPGYSSYPKNISYVLDGKGGYQPLSIFNPDGDVIHLRYATLQDVVYGYSPLQWCQPAVRTAVAAEALSELGFLYGLMPPGFLVHRGKPGDNLLASMEVYLEEIMRRPQRRHLPLPISGEWDYLTTSTSASDLKLVEQRKLAFSLASAVFGVPRALLGDPDQALSGTGVYQLQRAYAVLHAHEHLTTIGEGLSEALPRGYRIRIVPTHLLALEPAEQSRVFERLIKVGVMKPSEARAELGLPPIEGLDDEVLDKVLGGGPGDNGGDSDSGKDVGTQDEKTTSVDE